MDTPAKIACDVASCGVVLGTLTSVLPSVTAAASLVWVLIRIWETETVQRLLGRTRLAHKIADED